AEEVAGLLMSFRLVRKLKIEKRLFSEPNVIVLRKDWKAKAIPYSAVVRRSMRSGNSKGKNIYFPSFPKDRGIRKIWICRGTRKDIFNDENAQIFSPQFNESD
ncbi:hypothetical protein AVEN_100742-1, partial [Araneus ventricosus]